MMDKANLLVVDPDESARRETIALLEGAGWRVDAIGADFAALATAGRNLDLAAYGLILFNAGDSDGSLATVADLRRKDPHLPILQFASKHHRTVPGEAAVDALLVRPFEPYELLSLVPTLVSLRETRRAAAENETWLQLAQDAGGLAVVEMDLVSGRIRWSPKFSEIFHVPLEGSADLLRQRIHLDDLPGLVVDYENHRDAGLPLERDFRIALPNGTIRWIAARGKLVNDARARAERILFLCSDITERKEAELRNTQFAALVASSIDAIVSVDFDDVVRTWNHGAEQLFGYTAEEMLGRLAAELVPEDQREERAVIMQRLHAGETIEYHTLRRRKDGQLLNVWIRGAPVPSPDGVLCSGSLIIRDVTAQHRHEEHVGFLMRELTHRSKNLLAVIQAMARQTLSHLTTPEDFVARFSERLSGLAGSHDLLSSDDWAGASLVDLIKSQLQHYNDLFGERIFIEGADLFLRPEAAQNIGIALHELSTNAAKFGALSTPAGKVTIAWAFLPDSQGNRRLNLKWEERGGPRVVAPDHKGFGHMVMDRITGAALGGQSKVNFAADGVTWHLDVPIAAVTRATAGPRP